MAEKDSGVVILRVFEAEAATMTTEMSHEERGATGHRVSQ